MFQEIRLRIQSRFRRVRRDRDRRYPLFFVLYMADPDWHIIYTSNVMSVEPRLRIKYTAILFQTP